MKNESRPWGYFTTLLEGKDFKVKKIVVYPGKRLSEQYHKKRSEHWHCITGRGCAYVGGCRTHMKPGVSVDICVGSVHRVENQCQVDELVFIEIQLGICEEDDIVRLSDDYGRCDNGK